MTDDDMFYYHLGAYLCSLYYSSSMLDKARKTISNDNLSGNCMRELISHAAEAQRHAESAQEYAKQMLLLVEGRSM